MHSVLQSSSGTPTNVNNNILSKKVTVKTISFGGARDEKVSVTNRNVAKPKIETPSIIDNLPTIRSFQLNDEPKKVSPDPQACGSNQSSGPEQKKKDQISVSQPRVKGSYKDDYNILEIHNIIIDYFHQRKNNELETLKLKREAEIAKTRTPQTMVERKTSLSNIQRLEADIERISQDEDLKKYLASVKTFIEEYRSMGSLPKVVSFCGEKEPSPVEDSMSFRRHQIITEYLNIASHYIQIDLIREVENNYCKCGYRPPADRESNYNDLLSEDNGVKLCPSCNTEREIVSRSSFYRDTSRVNTSSRNNYEDRDNFYKALLRYQGKQQIRFPKDIFTKLDEYFTSYGLAQADAVKEMPLDKRGRRGKTNKVMMYKALSDIGYANYYEDVNLLCHLYWGWKLPDINNIEDAIMEDYDNFQRVFQVIKIDRKSCLNTQYMLWILLRRRGHPCSIDDFKMVKTQDIVDYHDDMCRTVFKVLGWSLTSVNN